MQKSIVLFAVLFLIAFFTVIAVAADDSAPPKGLRVVSTGNSFAFGAHGLLNELARSAGIKGHEIAASQGIGGSRVIQHWDVADAANKPKQALIAGNVDVMTMNPIYMPDEGIDKFVKLGLEKNPNMRFCIQQSWLMFDQIGEPPTEILYNKRKFDKDVDRTKRTSEEMRKLHAPYFKALEDYVTRLNKEAGKEAVYIIPIGQAAILLREKIIKHEAPDLTSQNDLFLDQQCHPSAILRTLGTYCYYATIYRRSPVGLPILSDLAKTKTPNVEKLNRLLQELAWQAVTEDPFSGVKAAK